MLKKLKTINQVKNLYFFKKDQYDGIQLWNKPDKFVHINSQMFEYFGNEIEVNLLKESEDDNEVYQYEHINRIWVFCKEWFVNDLFTDEEFMI